MIKNRVFLGLAIVLIVFVVIGISVFLMRQNKIKLQDPVATPNVETTSEVPQKTTPEPSLKTYTSQALNISFQFPNDWEVQEGNDYPGSAQGESYLKLTKGMQVVYAGSKTECLQNYTYCKSVTPNAAPTDRWPSFSTQSPSAEAREVIDIIVRTATHLR